MTEYAKDIRLLVIYSAFLFGTLSATLWQDGVIMTVALGVNTFVWCLAVGALYADIRSGNRHRKKVDPPPDQEA